MRKLYKPALKLAVCLIIFGGIYYFAIANTPSTSKDSDLTKLSALRSSLNESLIASGELASFNETDAAAGSVLDRLISSIEATLTDTEKTQKEASTLLKPSQNEEISQVVAYQREAIKKHKALSANLSQLIIYNPETDLGKLDLGKDKQELKDRSLAASKGLQTAIAKQISPSQDSLGVANAGEDAALSLDESTINQVKSTSECFSGLASAIDGPSAQNVRTKCVNDYSEMRGQVLRSLLETSFNENYLKDLQSQILPLLESIDSTLKTLET